MAVTNNLAKVQQNESRFSVAVQLPQYQELIRNTLGDPKRAMRFVASVTSVVAVNDDLKKCAPQSILSAALLGESLNLAPSPQLGQFYMVPYNDNKRGPLAQFQLGYKGYIQLAIRSGYYKKLNVLAIKAGELIGFDPLNEELRVQLIQDDEQREKAETIGYYAMFEYQNGFRKALYWSKEKMLAHAKRYSQGYASDLKKGNAYTFWSKDFDGMALKTMLRQLISKWGIMSTELQTAIEKDMAVITTDGNPEYIDHTNDLEDTQPPIKGVVEVSEDAITKTPPVEDEFPFADDPPEDEEF